MIRYNILFDRFKSKARLPQLKDTINLAIELHKGQVDHSGHPYFMHVLRVAEYVKSLSSNASDDLIFAALLHDTIEDCHIDENFLRQKGYSEECIEMIKHVTKPENDIREYGKVIDDLIASGNFGALLIKLADNMDNLHPQRIQNLAEHDWEKSDRLCKKYKASVKKLISATGLEEEKVWHLISNAPDIERKSTFIDNIILSI